MKFFSAVLAILLISACAQKATNVNEMNRMRYSCLDGTSLVVHFFPYQARAELLLAGDTHRLPQQPAASGFWYSNSKYAVRGKGKDLWLEVGRSMPLYCQHQAR